MSEIRWLAVVREGELDEGTSLAWCPLVPLPPEERYPLRVALYRWQGRYLALDARCPHYGGPLEGQRILYGGVIECPLHGWRFSLATGQCENFRGKLVQTYPVRIREGWIEVEVPSPSGTD